ncbi:MAG: hypothetical protein K9L30_12235 [Desulfobacterales bacterium]|nr:hypothetical protein [Desulfobacterales bacterium]
MNCYLYPLNEYKFFILFAVAALIAGFSANTMAADADVFASMRFVTAWDSYDTPAVDDSDLRWGLQGNSRIGANFSAGDLSGKYEVGLRGSNDLSAANGLYTRQLYGAWNFGSGELLIGQTYTPFFKPYGNDCCDDDFALLSHGEMYDSRNPMIQVKIDTFKLAFITPSTKALDPVFGTVSGGYVGNENNDTTLPKIALSYSIPLDMITLDFFGGYNKYEYNTEDVDSYAAGFGIMTNFDPAYINAKIWTAENAANYGMAIDTSYGYYNSTTDEDSETLAGLLVAGFRATETVNLEAGVGYQESERAANEEDRVIMYYGQARIDIVKNFFIVPEIAYFDYENDVLGDADRTVALIKWQIDL